MLVHSCLDFAAAVRASTEQAVKQSTVEGLGLLQRRRRNGSGSASGSGGGHEGDDDSSEKDADDLHGCLFWFRIVCWCFAFNSELVAFVAIVRTKALPISFARFPLGFKIRR